MDNILIVYCHPYEKSFNHAIMETLMQRYSGRELNSVDLIDLYADNFEPVYSSEEMKLFHLGKTTDPLVERYQQKIKKCTRLIIVTPIWWNFLPGVLKGFFDKVMKKDFSYTETDMGIKGTLQNIACAEVYTTSASPTWYLRFLCGNPIKKCFLNTTLKQLGIRQRRWVNFGCIGKSSQEERENYLRTLS